jgi:hypothetical protein
VVKTKAFAGTRSRAHGQDASGQYMVAAALPPVALGSLPIDSVGSIWVWSPHNLEPPARNMCPGLLRSSEQLMGLSPAGLHQ